MAAVLAIGAGFWGLWWQAGSQQRRENSRAVIEEVRRLNLMLGAIFTMRARMEPHSDVDLRLLHSRLGPVDEVASLIRTVPLMDFVDWRVAFAINQSIDCFVTLRQLASTKGVGMHPSEFFGSGNKLRTDTIAYLRAAERQIDISVRERSGQSVAGALEEWSAVLLETPKT